jgi:predicted acetyltransferase
MTTSEASAPDAEMTIRVTPDEKNFHHELRCGEETVSELWVVNLTMRIGVAEVRMGGIAGVGTPQQHRNKGYSRRCLENSNPWMTEEGFDCATLFGISDYYDKFGYAPCLASNTWTLPTRDAERAELHLNARPMEESDLPTLHDLYAQNNTALTGSIVRNDRVKWPQKGSWYGTPSETFLFTNSAGEAVAYATRDKANDRARIIEVGASDPIHYPSILRWAADYAVACRCENIGFLLPTDHPCAQTLTRYGVKLETHFPRNGAGMGRLLRLESFFEKTLPEWTRRAQATTNPGSSLRLETDIGNITLEWTGDAVALSSQSSVAGTVQLPQYRLMQLAMGYHSADFAPCLPGVTTSGDLTLFQTLFPRRSPYMWVADHF